MHLVSYAKNLETLHETPREIPMSFASIGSAFASSSTRS